MRDSFDDFMRDDVDPGRQHIDGSGNWALEPPRSKPDGPKATVVLSFKRLAGTEVSSSGPNLTALRQDIVVRLVFFYVGSGGNSWCAYGKQREGTQRDYEGQW